MGPLAEYDHNSMHYKNKSKIRERIVWADEKRIPLASEGADEDDLINKIRVDAIIIHHQVDSAQLRPSIMPIRKMAFGPKYTGEGKLDFYSQNKIPEPETYKEDFNDFERSARIQNPQSTQINRAKFVPVTNTKSNDLNCVSKRISSTKQSKKPGYQKPMICDPRLNSSDRNGQFTNYYPLNNQKCASNHMHQPKIKPTMPVKQQHSNTYMPPSDEIDSRNEIFAKAGTDPMYQDRKPLSNLQTHVEK